MKGLRLFPTPDVLHGGVAGVGILHGKVFEDVISFML